MTQEFLVSGRIVAGHPGKLRTKKDVRTKQDIIKDGEKVNQIYFALAVPKQVFDTHPTANGQTVRQILEAEARASFPNGVPQNFSWKYKDGDGIDSSGKQYSLREGYAGHYVINYVTEGFAPTLYKQEGNSYRQMNPEEIKCGDFVAVKTSTKFNGAFSPNTPGLYVNPQMILHVGYGQEIVSAGQDPDEAFAGYQAPQMAGMSATPMVNASVAAPVAAPAAYPQPSAAPAAYPQPVATPVAMPAPAHDFVQNVVAAPPPPPAAVAAPFPPAGWTAHPSAPGFYYMGQEVLSEQQLRERASIPGLPTPR